MIIIKDSSKWKDIPHSLWEGINGFTKSITFIKIFNVTSTNINMIFHFGIWMHYSKIHLENKHEETAGTILKKEMSVLVPSDTKMY